MCECVETASSKAVHETSSACKSGAAGSCRNSLHSKQVPPNCLWTTLELLFCLRSQGSSTSTSQSKTNEGTTEFQKKCIVNFKAGASISGNGVVFGLKTHIIFSTPTAVLPVQWLSLCSLYCSWYLWWLNSSQVPNELNNVKHRPHLAVQWFFAQDLVASLAHLWPKEGGLEVHRRWLRMTTVSGPHEDMQNLLFTLFEYLKNNNVLVKSLYRGILFLSLSDHSNHVQGVSNTITPTYVGRSLPCTTQTLEGL